MTERRTTRWPGSSSFTRSIGKPKSDPSEEKQAIRQEHSLPILVKLELLLEAKRPHLLPKSPAGQAATYLRNGWTVLNRYCESGLLSIDDNAAERAMRNGQ